jgi:hypothetical protein
MKVPTREKQHRDLIIQVSAEGFLLARVIVSYNLNFHAESLLIKNLKYFRL